MSWPADLQGADVDAKRRAGCLTATALAVSLVATACGGSRLEPETVARMFAETAPLSQAGGPSAPGGTSLNGPGVPLDPTAGPDSSRGPGPGTGSSAGADPSREGPGRGPCRVSG